MVTPVSEIPPTTPDQWFASALRARLKQRTPMHTLVLSGRHEALAPVGVPGACSVRVAGGDQAVWSEVHCRRRDLPFQMDVFDLVVLHEVVDQGDEGAIALVRRSMRDGSELLVMGCGRWSMDRWRGREPGRRSWRPGWLRGRLQTLGFEPRGSQGRGLLGLDQQLELGWQRSLLPLSDRLIVRARRRVRGRPDIRLVRFGSARSRLSGPATVEGLNRETAS